jgi:hypothetical protein
MASNTQILLILALGWFLCGALGWTAREFTWEYKKQKADARKDIQHIDKKC